MLACEKLVYHFKVSWWKCKDKSLKREGDLHGKRGTMWFLWKEGVKPSPIVSYLQFVVREHVC